MHTNQLSNTTETKFKHHICLKTSLKKTVGSGIASIQFESLVQISSSLTKVLHITFYASATNPSAETFKSILYQLFCRNILMSLWFIIMVKVIVSFPKKSLF